MMEKVSNKCKYEEGGRTKKDEIAENEDAGERQSTSAGNVDTLSTAENAFGYLHPQDRAVIMGIESGEASFLLSMYSEPEIIAPDGGWGWVIVLASFFMHVIGEY